jgi:hypothetical protein
MLRTCFELSRPLLAPYSFVVGVLARHSQPQQPIDSEDLSTD